MSDVDFCNRVLAATLVERLNGLLVKPEVRQDIQKLLQVTVDCSNVTCDHPTIQVNGENQTLGFLGLLNGMVGIIPEGDRAGWGFIYAEFDDQDNLIGFGLTEKV